MKWLGAHQCQQCRDDQIRQSQLKRTLREATSWTKSRDRFVYIRKLARQWIEEYGVEKKCVVCNFDIVVEVCHIKAITSFDLDSTLAEINAQDNFDIFVPKSPCYV